MKSTPFRIALFSFCTFAVSACMHSDHARKEAERMVRAVDAVIAADIAHKAQPLATLEATPCSTEDVCHLKTLCAEAFHLIVHAQQLQAEVDSTLHLREDKRADLFPQQATELRQKLDQADDSMRKTKDLIDGCLQTSSKVHQEHRL